LSSADLLQVDKSTCIRLVIIKLMQAMPTQPDASCQQASCKWGIFGCVAANDLLNKFTF
jgi:hypothetical protein